MASFSSQVLFGLMLLMMVNVIMARYEYETINKIEDIPEDDYENSEEQRFNEFRKIRVDDPNYLSRWPWLKDLLLTGRGDETQKGAAVETHYVDMPEPMPTPLPVLKVETPIKKNQYMSVCHFKICNMGRKRNVRFLRV